MAVDNGVCSDSTKLDENPAKYFLRPGFRFPACGYPSGAARQSFEFGDAAHGLPTGCHSPGAGRPRGGDIRSGLRMCPIAQDAPLR